MKIIDFGGGVVKIMSIEDVEPNDKDQIVSSKKHGILIGKLNIIM